MGKTPVPEPLGMCKIEHQEEKGGSGRGREVPRNQSKIDYTRGVVDSVEYCKGQAE